MATYTSNLNLKKPGLSDDALIADINGNMDLLDTDAGKLRADIAIVENGNTATHNIAEGQYVVWKGDLYIASAAIASWATLSSSNLTAKPNGLGGEVTSLSDQIGNVPSGKTLQGQIDSIDGRQHTYNWGVVANSIASKIASESLNHKNEMNWDARFYLNTASSPSDKPEANSTWNYGIYEFKARYTDGNGLTDGFLIAYAYGSSAFAVCNVSTNILGTWKIYSA